MPVASPSEQVRFVSSPQLSGLRSLSLWKAEAALIAATKNPALSALESLSITSEALGAECVEALAQSVFRDGLMSLKVASKPSDIVSIFEDHAWPALRWLMLSGDEQLWDDEGKSTMGDVDVERLAKCALLRQLEWLYLYDNDLSDAAILALAQSEALGELRGLELSGNKMGDRALIALIELGDMTKLEILGLADNQIGDAGAIALAASPLLAKLRIDYMGHGPRGGLRYNKIGLAGLLALLRSPYLDKTSELNMHGNPLTHQDILALAQEPALATMHGALRISVTDEREETWQALIDSPHVRPALRDYATLCLQEARRVER